MFKNNQKNIDLHIENTLLKSVRNSFISDTKIVKIDESKNFIFKKNVTHVYISLFQEGLQSIRWGSKRDSLEETLNRCINKIKEYPVYNQFDVANIKKCRILIEIITSEEKCDIKMLSQYSLNDRFEVGIDGLKLNFNNQEYYYMPTDATVKSHLTFKDILNFFAKKIGIAKYTPSISKRIEILKTLELEWFKTRSVAFVSYNDIVLSLYRGIPTPENITFEVLLQTSKQSIQWAIKNQKGNGQFLYYYDGVNDTEVDHEHQNMTNPLYYNMLRHSGGIIALLHMYEVDKNQEYLIAIENAIKYLISESVHEQVNNKMHAYVMCNSKAKLGGSGIALVALMMHHKITGNEENVIFIEAIVRHILSRIDNQGEMIGYYIHPEYHENKPLLELTDSEKRELFSFYYPGEALLGLALYYNNMKNIDNTLQKEIQVKALQALDFLVYERPKKYPEMFATLPSDSWLMQAIEEWAKNIEFQKKAYLNFVFEDAKVMIRQMYNTQNALYPDYVGAYFYYYGEHAYPDAARSEGLVAAYNLAKYMNNDQMREYIFPFLQLAVQNMMYVFNNNASTYMHRFPKKSEGSFRLKLTRQWTRIDMTQHAVSFFIRFLQTLQKETYCQ